MVMIRLRMMIVRMMIVRMRMMRMVMFRIKAMIMMVRMKIRICPAILRG